MFGSCKQIATRTVFSLVMASTLLVTSAVEASAKPITMEMVLAASAAVKKYDKNKDGEVTGADWRRLTFAEKVKCFNAAIELITFAQATLKGFEYNEIVSGLINYRKLNYYDMSNKVLSDRRFSDELVVDTIEQIINTTARGR